MFQRYLPVLHSLLTPLEPPALLLTGKPYRVFPDIGLLDDMTRVSSGCVCLEVDMQTSTPPGTQVSVIGRPLLEMLKEQTSNGTRLAVPAPPTGGKGKGKGVHHERGGRLRPDLTAASEMSLGIPYLDHC